MLTVDSHRPPVHGWSPGSPGVLHSAAQPVTAVPRFHRCLVRSVGGADRRSGQLRTSCTPSWFPFCRLAFADPRFVSSAQHPKSHLHMENRDVPSVEAVTEQVAQVSVA